MPGWIDRLVAAEEVLADAAPMRVRFVDGVERHTALFAVDGDRGEVGPVDGQASSAVGGGVVVARHVADEIVCVCVL